MSYHHTPIRMAGIKDSDATKRWSRFRNGSLRHCQWELQTTGLATSIRLNMRLCYRASFTRLDIYPRKKWKCMFTQKPVHEYSEQLHSSQPQTWSVTKSLPLRKPILERQVLMSRKVVYFQVPTTWKMGDSCCKAHLHISVEAEGLIRRERGTEQRDQGRGLQSSLRADEHSPFWSDKWWSSVRHHALVIPASCHPGSVDEGQQIPWSWDAWRSESASFETSS